jgi:glycosyltransferase involved in cell wall biosynthesis
MSHRFAIFVPSAGEHSETFIRRHIEDLLPDETVLVTGTNTGHWGTRCPTLTLDQLPSPRLRRRLATAMTQKLGWRPDDAPMAAVRRFLREHRVEVALGEYLDVSLQWLPLAGELGIRFFGHAHGYDVSANLREERWRKNYLRYAEADGIVTINEISRKRLLELGLPPAKVHVVHYGVDVPTAPPRHDVNATVRCLAVGRMVSKKAPILLLDAFRRASEVFPAMQLDYVGDGPLFSAAHDFVQTMKLQAKITLHGARANGAVQNLMRDADMFLQHSITDPATGDEEGLPVAVLEAMANALPVVATRHAGIPEAVLEGATGYLVDEGDTASMADRIVALARDADRRRNMGRAGWQRAGENFSREKERAALLNILGLHH